MKKHILLSLTVLCGLVVSAQIPQASSGKIVRYEQFPSAYVTARNVDIWLPNNYDTTQRYAVLYMHDGQMLFDSSITWNKQAWEVDEVAASLINSGKTKPFIVVGIWNGGLTRHTDYCPQKPVDNMPELDRDSFLHARRPNGQLAFNLPWIKSDDYLRFIVRELKPYIDSTYATRPEVQHTYIAGSSMGGLISIYALCEYPAVFGGAACLSTHWPGVFKPENPFPEAMYKYLKAALPKANSCKIYFDFGNQTLDAMYPPFQAEVDKIMRKKGYKDSHWITRFYPDADHSERAWRQRLHIPLEFLLGK